MGEQNSSTSNVLPNKSLIYWVRHGETLGNYERIYTDPLTAFLTDRGRLQSKLAGQALADVAFTRAYSSNLPRATETARIILEESKYSKEVQLIVDDRIREKEHREFLGRSYDEGNALRGKGIDESHPLFPYAHFYIKGTEEIQNVLARADSFFQDFARDLNESPSPETVLIVGHGYFTDLWMTHIALETTKHKVVNYSKDLTITLHNCSYHKLLVSLEEESPDQSQGQRKVCWEFLEVHNEQHLSSVGFSVIRR